VHGSNFQTRDQYTVSKFTLKYESGSGHPAAYDHVRYGAASYTTATPISQGGSALAGRVGGLSLIQEFQKLTGVNDFGDFVRFGEVLGVFSHDVVGFSRERTFVNAVIFLMSGYLQSAW
jgi:hypothetical protein